MTPGRAVRSATCFTNQLINRCRRGLGNRKNLYEQRTMANGAASFQVVIAVTVVGSYQTHAMLTESKWFSALTSSGKLFILYTPREEERSVLFAFTTLSYVVHRKNYYQTNAIIIKSKTLLAYGKYLRDDERGRPNVSTWPNISDPIT